MHHNNRVVYSTILAWSHTLIS